MAMNDYHINQPKRCLEDGEVQCFFVAALHRHCRIEPLPSFTVRGGS